MLALRVQWCLDYASDRRGPLLDHDLSLAANERGRDLAPDRYHELVRGKRDVLAIDLEDPEHVVRRILRLAVDRDHEAPRTAVEEHTAEGQGVAFGSEHIDDRLRRRWLAHGRRGRGRRRRRRGRLLVFGGALHASTEDSGTDSAEDAGDSATTIHLHDDSPS